MTGVILPCRPPFKTLFDPNSSLDKAKSWLLTAVTNKSERTLWRERGRAGEGLLMHTSDGDEKPAYLMRNRDTKFTAHFDDVLKAEGVKVKVLTVQSPNLNSRCKRVIQSIKQECLDYFLVFGEQHLNDLVREYVQYFNDDRAHSSRYLLPPRAPTHRRKMRRSYSIRSFAMNASAD